MNTNLFLCFLCLPCVSASLLLDQLVAEWNSQVEPMLLEVQEAIKTGNMEVLTPVIGGFLVCLFLFFLVSRNLGEDKTLVGSKFSTEGVIQRARERDAVSGSPSATSSAKSPAKSPPRPPASPPKPKVSPSKQALPATKTAPAAVKSRHMDSNDGSDALPESEWGMFGVHTGDATMVEEERYLPMRIDGKVVVRAIKEGEFKVCNQHLKNGSVGMQYRISKDIDHRDTNSVVPWDTVLKGVQDGDWVKCQAKVPKRSLLEDSIIRVSQVKKVNGVVWLKRSDQDDGKDEWLHLHDHGVQIYYPITPDMGDGEDRTVDDDFRPRVCDLQDRRSKFTSDKGNRLTHMVLLKDGRCNVSGAKLDAGSIVLRDDKSDWNMSLEVAEERGLRAELTRLSPAPEFRPMVPVRPRRPMVCHDTKRRISDKPRAPDNHCFAGCGAQAPPPKALACAFVPASDDGRPDDANGFVLCAAAMEQSPEFADAPALKASSANTRGNMPLPSSPLKEASRGLDPVSDSIYVYVPKPDQTPMYTWDPDTPRSVTTPASLDGTAFSTRQRFHITDRRITKGEEWLKVAGGWVNTCNKAGERVVFPLEEAIRNCWVPEEEYE